MKLTNKSMLMLATIFLIGNCASSYANAVDQCIEQMNVRNADIRMDAVKKLAVSDDPQALEILLSALHDKNREVRQRVTRSIWRFMEPRAVDPMINFLKDEDDNFRDTARISLAGMINVSLDKLLLALSDPDPKFKVQVIETLYEARDPHAVDALIPLLHDPNSEVRTRTAQTLAAIGDVRAVDPLIEQLKDKEADVQVAVIEALGSFRSKKTADALVSIAQKSRKLSGPVAEALNQQRDPRAIDYLFAGLEYANENPEDVSSFTSDIECSVDGYPRNAAAVPAIIKYLKSDDPLIQIIAIKLLYGIDDQRIISPLITMLKQFSEDVRNATIDDLANIEDSRVTEALINVMNKDESFDVRESAARALGRIGGPRAVNALIAVLNKNTKDEYYAEVKNSAAHGLLESCDSFALNPLAQAIKKKKLSNDILYACPIRPKEQEYLDKLENLLYTSNTSKTKNQTGANRTKVATGLEDVPNDSELKHHQHEKYVDSIIASLKDSKSNKRMSAASDLGTLGDKRAVPPLIEALADEDQFVVMSALKSLGQLGGKQAADALIDYVKKKRDNWTTALAALGDVADPRALNVIIEQLKFGSLEGTRAAVAALGGYSDPRSRERLLKAVKDPDSGVRAAAVESLGKIGTTNDADIFIAALDDSDQNVRKKAIEIIGDIGDKRAIEPLINALRDQSIQLNEQALTSLWKITGQDLGWNPSRWHRWWQSKSEKNN